MKLNLKHFFGLIKAQQKPYEDALVATMQEKVDWIKKNSSYDLNQRQKQSLERDKTLITVTEAYITIQQKIIEHLFRQLEQMQAEASGHLHDKLAAEKALRDLIQKQHEVHPAA